MTEYRIRHKKTKLFFGTNKYGKKGGKRWFSNAWKAYANLTSAVTACLVLMDRGLEEEEDLEIVEVGVVEIKAFSPLRPEKPTELPRVRLQKKWTLEGMVLSAMPLEGDVTVNEIMANLSGRKLYPKVGSVRATLHYLRLGGEIKRPDKGVYRKVKDVTLVSWEDWHRRKECPPKQKKQSTSSTA